MGTPAYVRYTTAPQAQYSDEDMPKRSSAGRKESSRRSSETPAVRTEKSSRRRSPLQTYTSAPPNLTREQPSRSKTQDYPRKEAAMPSLPRAATFQSGDRPRASGSSKLRQQYTSDSESDSPVYQQSPRPRSPPPPRRSEPTRYIVENGKTKPVGTTRPHRSEMRDDYPQDRSESPRGTPGRPSISRNPPSSERPRANRTQSATYYQPEPDPIVLTARPKLDRVGSSQRQSSRGPTGGGAYFDNVSYGTAYQPEHVIYSKHAAGLQDYARRGIDGRDSREYYRAPLYA